MPFKKQSGSGVCITPSFTKNTLAPVASYLDIAAVIEHQRIGIALGLGLMHAHVQIMYSPAALACTGADSGEGRFQGAMSSRMPLSFSAGLK